MSSCQKQIEAVLIKTEEGSGSEDVGDENIKKKRLKSKGSPSVIKEEESMNESVPEIKEEPEDAANKATKVPTSEGKDILTFLCEVSIDTDVKDELVNESENEESTSAKESSEDAGYNVITNSDSDDPNSRSYGCNTCGKVFGKKSNLKQHLVIHSGTKPFMCEQCGRSFSTKSNLKQHLASHSDLKPFSCDQCGKSFSLKNNLRQHVRFHTGEKLYQCSYCPKSFSLSSNLKTHVRIHSGEKPFGCNFCGKRFTISTALKKHQTIHSRIK